MQSIHIKGGELLLHPDFLTESESTNLFERLLESTSWNQDEIQIFGKWHKQPRLTAIYADKGVKYSYSGLTQKTAPWPDYLLPVKQKIESTAGADFNLVLLNYYRDGQDSMGWHSDDEKELGKNPCIASLSIGAARDFKFRPKKNIDAKPFIVNLSNGSLLIMIGETQEHWQHSIAKSKKVLAPRINLTFRRIN